MTDKSISLFFLFLLMACVSACSNSSHDQASSTQTNQTVVSSTSKVQEANVSNEPAKDNPTADVTELLSSEFLGSYSFTDEKFGTSVTVMVDATSRTITSNALPNHETGEFPNSGNPNTISSQNSTYTFTTVPTFTGLETQTQIIGVAINGVKFEPGTAETVTCGNGDTYRVEGLQNTFPLGMDFNNAHVQPTGEYHYHGVSKLLINFFDMSNDLVHIGFAADGYRMYYSKSGAFSSGYELSSTPRSGFGCEMSLRVDNNVFDLEETQPDGTYTSDWVYTEGLGDLDSCNGTTIEGEYMYLITDGFPFISRCLNGEITGGQGAPQRQGNEGTRQGPDLTEAAATLGITVRELASALGGPPPNFDSAAATLGITIKELLEALP
jgi:hypothetical protein